MRNSKGLQRLIIGCLDDERALHYESGIVHHNHRLVLSRLADERVQFADRLRALGEPGAHETRSWRGALRELLRAVRVLVGGRNNGDSVAACRRSCARTEALYDQAVKLQWSQPILPTLLEQREHLRRSCGELLGLQF